jgi:succinate-acetate transporter protein
MRGEHDAGRMTYERFLQFEQLMGVYPRGSLARMNPRPLGFCAFALTFFVYSMYLTGATVPQTMTPAPAMGLGLFYGGVIQLIAGILELRLGNNFFGLQFCSYGGYFLGLASLYVSGSFGFFNGVATTNYITVGDFSMQEKSLGVFYLGWTIFTLCLFLGSFRTNILNIVYLFFLMVTFALWTAAKFLTTNYSLQTAGGAIGIFVAALAWITGFTALLRKGENYFFNLPNYNLEPKPKDTWADQPVPVETHSTTRK